MCLVTTLHGAQTCEHMWLPHCQFGHHESPTKDAPRMKPVMMSLEACGQCAHFLPYMPSDWADRLVSLMFECECS